jgi:hypothetical protein
MRDRRAEAVQTVSLVSALFFLFRFRPARYFRWLAQLDPRNASRNRVLRVVLAASLLISDFAATVAPAYAQTSSPVVTVTAAGQGYLQAPSSWTFDSRTRALARTATSLLTRFFCGLLREAEP